MRSQRPLGGAGHDGRDLPLSLVRLGPVRPGNPAFQLVESHAWLADTIRFKLGVDGFSMPFVLLTTFLMPFCILASWDVDRDTASRSTWSPSWCSRR